MLRRDDALGSNTSHYRHDNNNNSSNSREGVKAELIIKCLIPSPPTDHNIIIDVQAKGDRIE